MSRLSCGEDGRRSGRGHPGTFFADRRLEGIRLTERWASILHRADVSLSSSECLKMPRAVLMHFQMSAYDPSQARITVHPKRVESRKERIERIAREVSQKHHEALKILAR